MPLRKPRSFRRGGTPSPAGAAASSPTGTSPAPVASDVNLPRTPASADPSISEDGTQHTSSSLNSSFLNRWGDLASSNNLLPPPASSENMTDHAPATLLLGGLPTAFPSDTAGIPTRPQRLWKVQDTKLPPFPSFFYPKPVVACTVTATSPSVIAIRIAECLTKRSVAAEYDDETAVAYCVTVDRVHLTVHLWNYNNSNNNSNHAAPSAPEVLVECQRVSGNSISFHQTARAILQAAQSLDSGADRRLPHQCAPMDYPRMMPSQQAAADRSSSGPKAAAAVEALEQAYQLLCKDRLDAQLSGLESLVHLTDVTSVGSQVACTSAVAILGGTATTTTTADSSLLLRQIHTDWILKLVLGQKRLSSEQPPTPSPGEALRRTSPTADETEEGDNDMLKATASHMRALALWTFSNALSVLDRHDPDMLQQLLASTASAGPPVLTALVHDLRGASRPASVGGESGPHEAALAVKILGLLGAHSADAKDFMLNDESFLDQLDKVASIGRSTHAVLAAEARQTYLSLTEEDRSC